MPARPLASRRDGKRLGSISIPSQPELERVLQTIADAVNNIVLPDVRGGNGIRVSQDSGGFRVSLLEDVLLPLRPLYPCLVANGGSNGVTLSPGWVVFPRKGKTSLQAVPYIGADPGTGVPLNDVPAPSVALSAGTYYSRLELQTGGTARLEFVNVSDPPEEGKDYLVINKFKVSVSGGVRSLQVMEIYLDRPIAAFDSASPDKWFTVSDDRAPDDDPDEFFVAVSDGRVYGPDGSGFNAKTPTFGEILDGVDVGGGSFAVADGDGVYVKITVDAPANITTEWTESSDDFVKVDYISLNRKTQGRNVAGEVEVHASPPAGSATVSYVLLAEIEITDGAMTIHQRNDGAIYFSAVSIAYAGTMEIHSDIRVASYNVCEDGVGVSVNFLVEA